MNRLLKLLPKGNGVGQTIEKWHCTASEAEVLRATVTVKWRDADCFAKAWLATTVVDTGTRDDQAAVHSFFVGREAWFAKAAACRFERIHVEVALPDKVESVKATAVVARSIRLQRVFVNAVVRPRLGAGAARQRVAAAANRFANDNNCRLF